MSIPDFIVHYSRGEPFLSMSDVPHKNLQGVLGQLNQNNAWGLNRFSDPDYLSQRIEVERKIRNDFLNIGGKPELENPIYFFLGRNTRFEEHEKNKGYMIRLSDLSPSSFSFTYGDSMISLCEKNRQRIGEEYLSHLCSRVYRLEELADLFFAINNSPGSLHIECQLWKKPTSDIIRRVE